MAMSFSLPDPGNPAQIADASFATARRGFDQDEVRDFLRMVAAEMSRLSERVRFLEREVEAAQTSPELSARLDEETLTRLLGEETARVLSAARASATEIREKAERSAAQLVGEAGDEAARLREEVELESSRRRSDAAADAEAEVEMAKQQGREMVNEARAYRERVLSELARRRELAREQIEQLVQGRDLLIAAFERARVAAVDVMSDLEPLGEPDQYVNLTPTTGPVPVMVAREQQAAAPDPQPDTPVEPEVVEAVAIESEADEVETEAEVADPEPEAVEVVEGDEEVVEPEAEVVEVEAVASEEPEEATADAEPEAEAERSSPSDEVVVDLFAKLRSASDALSDDAEPVSASVEPAPVDPQPEETPAVEGVDDAAAVAEEVVDLERTPFERRDAELTPLIVSAARKLKRVLADEQNDVLQSLRELSTVERLDDLVPVEPEQAGRYVDAIAEDLLLAAQSGAGSTDPDGVVTLGRADARDCVDRAGDELAERLITPLRLRLERSIADAAGDVAPITKSVRAVYREVKTQHIDDALDDVFRCAHGAGQSAAIPDGASVVWVVDGRHPGCPDGDDNALSPPVAHGEEFPTGHVSTPAHPGCRCMLQITRR